MQRHAEVETQAMRSLYGSREKSQIASFAGANPLGRCRTVGLALLCALGLITPFSPAAAQTHDQVRVTGDYSQVSGCQSLGQVNSSVNTRLPSNVSALHEQLRQHAANLGGNVVVTMGAPVSFKHRMQLSGEAFKCGSASFPTVALGAAALLPVSSTSIDDFQECRAHFAENGSAMRGTTYRSSVDFASEARPGAIRRLTKAMPSFGFTVVSSDEQLGRIQAESRDAYGKNYPLDVTAADGPEGAHVEGTIRLPILMRSETEQFEERLCRLLTAQVGPQAPSLQEAPTTPVAGGNAPPAPPVSVEERLRKLDELFKKGLLTEVEYKAKRAEILKDL